MPKYLFAYHGGKRPTNEVETKKYMDAWGAWFGSLGKSVIDGGNPLKPSSTVHANSSVTQDGGSNPVGGYSLITATDMADAQKKAKGCPILASGGSVEVAEAMDM